jgi:hypothetical protein
MMLKLCQILSYLTIHSTFLYSLQERKVEGITNTCLHELYDDQQNYNTINIAGKDTFSIVTKKNPTFTIPNE